AKPFPLDTGRIGFERDLRALRDRPEPRDRIENGADGRRLHQGWRAAAKKNRGNGAALRQLRAVRELRFIGLDKAVIVNRLRAHMAVEIAIRTFGEAKRPMHIDPETWTGAKLTCRRYPQFAHAISCPWILQPCINFSRKPAASFRQ